MKVSEKKFNPWSVISIQEGLYGKKEKNGFTIV